MARNPGDQVRQLQLLRGMIPADIVRDLDESEIYDRLVQACSLIAKSEAETSPALRKSWASLAHDVLTAQPRVVTERQVAEQMAKAARSSDPELAHSARARAAAIQAANPIAPRRQSLAMPSTATRVRPRTASVRKDKGDPMLVAFDADGKILGIVDPADVQPVGNSSTKQPSGKPAPAASGAAGTEVAKRRTMRAARRTW